MQLVVGSSNHMLSSNHRLVVQSCPSLVLRSGIGFRTQITCGGSALGEEAREDWLNEGPENDLGATCLRESHPQDEDELEGVVES